MEKRERMKRNCQRAQQVVLAALVLLGLIILLLLGYAAVGVFQPGEAFAIEPYHGGYQVFFGERLFISAYLEPEVVTAQADAIHNPKAAFFSAMGCYLFIKLSTAWLSLYWLWRILGRAGAGRPFDLRSARDLQKMGVALFGASVLYRPVLSALLAFFAADGYSLSIPLNISPVLLPLLLILLSYLFEYGAQLQQEVDETI